MTRPVASANPSATNLWRNLPQKVKISLAFALAVVLVVIGSALADYSVTQYSDTSAYGYDRAGSDKLNSLVVNGDFGQWHGDTTPVGWAVWANNDAGWETRLSQMDYAASGSGGNNYAMGLFVRNSGGSGAQYMGAWQPLNQVAGGDYWVTVHITAWQEGVTSAYNSSAWYGIGSSSDAGSVTEWRELFPNAFVCDNAAQICNHLGRKETVYIPAGSYLHVMVGHKFPDYNANTLFGIDDISIVSSTGENGRSGWVAEGVVTWLKDVIR